MGDIVLGMNILYYDSDKYGRRITTFIREFAPAHRTKIIFYAKGIAICSLEDQFRRKTGRNMAQQRAEKVMDLLMNCEFDLEKYVRAYDEQLCKRQTIQLLTKEDELSDREKWIFKRALEKEQKRISKS